jgi:hypothetical protein
MRTGDSSGSLLLSINQPVKSCEGDFLTRKFEREKPFISCCSC